MRLRMQRPPLPTDHLSSDLSEEVDLEVQEDGTFEGADAGLLNNDTVFLHEVIAAMAEELEKKTG